MPDQMIEDLREKLLLELQTLQEAFNPKAMLFDHKEKDSKEQYEWVREYNVNERRLDRVAGIKHFLSDLSRESVGDSHENA